MAFLQPDSLPAMAEAIHRQLVAARGNRLTEESLRAFVVPKGISKGQGADNYFSYTLGQLTAIGAVIADENQISLPTDPDYAQTPGAMRDLVRSKAMAAERQSDLWEKDESGTLSLLGARDLVRVFAWFLSLDVLSGPYTYDGSGGQLGTLQRDHTREYLIYNKTRWLPFVRWGQYLGLLSKTSLYAGSGTSETAVIPDPTNAVRSVLPRCVPRNDWVPFSTAIAAIGKELPVIDQGIYRKAILERRKPDWDADCSPSLTLAFERLRASGEIEFDPGAGDAQKTVLANNRGAFHALRLVARP